MDGDFWTASASEPVCLLKSESEAACPRRHSPQQGRFAPPHNHPSPHLTHQSIDLPSITHELRNEGTFAKHGAKKPRPRQESREDRCQAAGRLKFLIYDTIYDTSLNGLIFAVILFFFNKHSTYSTPIGLYTSQSVSIRVSHMIDFSSLCLQ